METVCAVVIIYGSEDLIMWYICGSEVTTLICFSSKFKSLYTVKKNNFCLSDFEKEFRVAYN